VNATVTSNSRWDWLGLLENDVKDEQRHLQEPMSMEAAATRAKRKIQLGFGRAPPEIFAVVDHRSHVLRRLIRRCQSSR
jgi:hypothetical protein